MHSAFVWDIENAEKEPCLEVIKMLAEGFRSIAEAAILGFMTAEMNQSSSRHKAQELMAKS
jgi:hypothetical protein